MFIDFRYRDFNSEMAVFLLKRDCSFCNPYMEEYVTTLTQEEFYWFMSAIIKQQETGLTKSGD